MTATYFEPPVFHFTIPQGQHFHIEFPAFLDATTGEAFDFTADPEGDWSARMDLCNESGSVLTTFASDGSEDGSITLGSDGVVACDLNDEYTAALPAPSTYVSTTLARADLVLTDPTDGEDWLWFKGRGKITKKVTS